MTELSHESSEVGRAGPRRAGGGAKGAPAHLASPVQHVPDPCPAPPLPLLDLRSPLPTRLIAPWALAVFQQVLACFVELKGKSDRGFFYVY